MAEARFVRTKKKGTVHRPGCAKIFSGKYVGVPVDWEWAEDKTLPEIRDEITRLGVKACTSCKPVDDITEWYAQGCPGPDF